MTICFLIANSVQIFNFYFLYISVIVTDDSVASFEKSFNVLQRKGSKTYIQRKFSRLTASRKEVGYLKDKRRRFKPSFFILQHLDNPKYLD